MKRAHHPGCRQPSVSMLALFLFVASNSSCVRLMSAGDGQATAGVDTGVDMAHNDRGDPVQPPIDSALDSNRSDRPIVTSEGAWRDLMPTPVDTRPSRDMIVPMDKAIFPRDILRRRDTLTPALDLSDLAVITPVDSGVSPLDTLQPAPAFWLKRAGNKSDQQARAIAVDAKGNIYVTGRATGAIDFGGGLQAAGYATGAFFVASFDAAGKHRWSRIYSGTGSATGYAIAIDSAANVYVTGGFEGSIVFDNTGSVRSSQGSSDIFVLSVDTAGVTRWTWTGGSTLADRGKSIAISPKGKVAIAGTLSGNTTFGSDQMRTYGGSDIFLGVFSAAGTPAFGKVLGGAGNDFAAAIAFDAASNLYAAGSFRDTLLVGQPVGRLASAGSHDLIVVSFSPGNTLRFAKRFGGKGYDVAADLAVNAAGSFALTGSFSGSTSFGGATVTPQGLGDVFVASYTTAGAHVWSTSFGGSRDDHGRSVAIDATGQVTVLAEFSGRVTLGTKVHSSAKTTATDMLIATFTSGGNLIRSEDTQGDASVHPWSLFDSGSALHLAGDFSGRMTLAGRSVLSTGTADIFIARHPR